ncbi:glycosyltransferase family 4 protein [Granulicella sibirica]|uniref:Glycosyltransferase n=1 Tax=Granulicella sibirica TaxID=2479048 RepID=A0A4Q0T8S9_9BACT|nr:glycosyltransferase family 1 protein [Granulicella sibirica]RXH58439.1 Glycosyltransferase [Granulicella sibirica]
MKLRSTARSQTTRTLCIDLRWIDKSGVGTYIKGVMPGIVELLPDVSIVGLGDRKRLEEFSWSGSPRVRLLDCRAAVYSIAEQVQILRAIPSETTLFFSPYYTIPLLYSGKIAVTVHDLSHRIVAEIIENPRKRLYAQAMYKGLRKKSSLIFTVSDFSKSELLRLTHGPREDNIIPVHLGISPEWYEASLAPKIRTRPYYVHVGNIKPYKNLGRLVDAFLAIRDRVPHDLVIVGQGEGLITGESREFFERVQAASDRIHLTGFVSHKELLSLVGHAEALLMPSLYEGFGLPPLEAMAAGVPVAVANAGSLPEVCGDAALYFDPLLIKDIGEKLVLIATDSALRRQLIDRGLERSRLFTWDLCARRTAEGLRSMLGSDRK